MINNNVITVGEISFPAEGYVPEKAVLKEVRVSYKKDENGKITEDIDATRYHCINPDNFDTFTVKVPGKKPVISLDEFKKLETVLYLEIPVSETLIKPFVIEYGKVKVSIIAPEVRIAKN